ncbi:MAG: pseudouridine synthase [Acutalibacteraceae bacterium]
MSDESMVLQKFLAQCSVGSRRKCQKIIEEGRVKLNGKPAKLGDRVNVLEDSVFLDGKKLELNNSERYYIMLNKPRGFVTTMSDEKGRKCVADLVKDIPARIYPVGRLDRDSEGLLIMTNDGDFANNMIHPSKNIWKTYRVTVRPSISEDQLTALCVGMEIDSKLTEPARVNVLTQEKGRVVLEISIKEGRNRQIRKMCEAVGLEVARLKRISIGTLKLGMLSPGKWRNLTKDELKLFKQNRINK